MQTETFDLKSLAKYLGRDARDLEKLASQGRLPGQRIAGDWRFHRAEVHHWLEREMPTFSDVELEHVEAGVRGTEARAADGFVVRPLMAETTTVVQLEGRTAPGVLGALVKLAETTWQVYDPTKLLHAIRDREAIESTALAGGVAVPHPGRRMADILGDSMLVFGRTSTGIPFGAERGQLTDLFFLVLCRDDRTHLQCLARLARMFQREGFLDHLRSCESPAEVLDAVEETEEDVI